MTTIMNADGSPFCRWLDAWEFNPFYNSLPNNGTKATYNKETNSFDVSVEVPGFDKDEITVTFDKGYLRVSAEVSKENEFKSFYHSVYLGDVDLGSNPEANLKNGVLTLSAKKLNDGDNSINVKVKS